MRWISDLLKDYLRKVNELRSPPLPVGIFLFATFLLVAHRDTKLSSLIEPHFLKIAGVLHIAPNFLYVFFCLFILPIMFLLVIRENPRDYGLSFGNVRLAVPVLVLLLVGFTVLGLFVASLNSFKQFYISSLNKPSDYVFLFLSYFTYMWGWEFINRGFLLFGLRKYVGVYSVYIQLIPFVILHLGKPPFELYGSIIFGLFFGFYAYVVDSFIYCAILHAYFAFIINVFINLS